MHEEFLTAAWLVEQIESGTDLQAYMDLIPENVPLPAVRMSAQERQDVRGIGDERERIMVRIDWLVVVIREGHQIAPLVPLVNSLDTALQNTNGSTDDIVVLSCVRLEPFSLLEVEDSGVTYRHAGGFYRTMVQVP